MADTSCAERIGDHLNGRISDLGALRDLAGTHDANSLATVLEDGATRTLFLEVVGSFTTAFQTDTRDSLRDMDPDTLLDLLAGLDVDEIAEAARERMHELPLGVSSYTAFRIDLSTGGPGDWLEVVCNHDGSMLRRLDDGPYEVERIVYHFVDWFDHAERQLDGHEFEVAEEFARSVVPELVW